MKKNRGGRYGEVWGGMGRYGEVWRGMAYQYEKETRRGHLQEARRDDKKSRRAEVSRSQNTGEANAALSALITNLFQKKEEEGGREGRKG